MRTLLRNVAEVTFMIVLFPLWPLLRAWTIFFPNPFPPVLTPLLEGPLRRRLQNRDSCLTASGLVPGQRVLEIGPGGGYVTEGILARLGSSPRIVCLDLQIDMLRQIRARFGRDSSALVCASGSCLPFRPGSFDLVILVGVLGEIPDEDGALRECHRVLDAGGTLAVSESLPDPDYIRASVLERRARAAGLVPGERITSRFGYTQRLRASLADPRPRA
jgi:ubiquinone/menaquinone biosynthesis C-methylase UbiE